MPTWNTAFSSFPAGTVVPSQLDDAIRALKAATHERLIKEHVGNLASGLVAEDGWHRPGSAKAYYLSDAPLYRPDGTTPLSADDYGRLWVNKDTKYLYGYTDDDSFELLVPPSSLILRDMICLTSGTSWTPTYTGWVKIAAIGGGGGGHNGVGGYYGGGGGGCAIDILYVTAGTEYTYSVGLGGALDSDGGATTITIGGVTLTGGGGLRGVPPNYGAGGSASGGTQNLNGGKGLQDYQWITASDGSVTSVVTSGATGGPNGLGRPAHSTNYGTGGGYNAVGVQGCIIIEI